MAAHGFLTPHSSDMDGVWGQMIGVTCRILDTLLKMTAPRLSHKVLVTLTSEVMAIMNAQPVVAVSSDPCPPLFCHMLQALNR